MKALVKSFLAAGALAGLVVATGTAQMALPRNLNLAKGSQVWLEGTSTVRSYKCTAQKVDVAVMAEPDAAPAEIVQSAALTIPVASLECGNGTMNEHMKKALKASNNPTIAWKMTSYNVEGTNVVINGKLTIAGKENAIELRGTGTAANGTVRFKGSKKFNMSEFGVKPPTLMLGTMKVGDPVTVSFDLILNS